MAVRSSVNIDTPIRRLRETNNSLLDKLKKGQLDARKILNEMDLGKVPFSSSVKETNFTFRGTDRTPIPVTRRERHSSNFSRDAGLKTPKTYGAALTENGNRRKNKTPQIPP